MKLNSAAQSMKQPARCWDGKQAERDGSHAQHYLQVCADPPQHIVHTVTGDERHKDVLQEREKAMGGAPLRPDLNPSYRPENRLTCPGVFKRRFPIRRAG